MRKRLEELAKQVRARKDKGTGAAEIGFAITAQVLFL